MKIASLSDLQKITIKFRDERDWTGWHTPENMMLGLFCEAAELAEHFKWPRDKKELDDYIGANLPEIAEEISDVLWWLLIIAHEVGIEPGQALVDKLKLNLKKLKSSQKLELDLPPETIEECVALVQSFRHGHGFDIDSPKVAMLKMIEELGELAEFFHPDQKRQPESAQIAEEWSDVLICLCIIIDYLDLDMPHEFVKKSHKNGVKYPVEAQNWQTATERKSQGL